MESLSSLTTCLRRSGGHLVVVRGILPVDEMMVALRLCVSTGHSAGWMFRWRSWSGGVSSLRRRCRASCSSGRWRSWALCRRAGARQTPPHTGNDTTRNLMSSSSSVHHHKPVSCSSSGLMRRSAGRSEVRRLWRSW